MPKLGVNIDHVATLRQARGVRYPDPVTAAGIVELAGANGIVAHLREDRRHMQDRDIHLLREVIQTQLNFEMAATDEMVRIALSVKPEVVTLVPERREELTTEGGLDVVKLSKPLRRAVQRLQRGGSLSVSSSIPRGIRSRPLKRLGRISSKFTPAITAMPEFLPKSKRSIKRSWMRLTKQPIGISGSLEDMASITATSSGS
jgi:hypothetical protein